MRRVSFDVLRPRPVLVLTALTALTALLALAPTAAPGGLRAQQPEPRPPRTAEEHHEARRRGLEQQRRGDSTAAAPVYGGARGPASRPPSADVARPGYGPVPGGAHVRTGSPGGAWVPGAALPYSAWCVAALNPVHAAGRGPGLPLVALEALCVPGGPAYPGGGPVGHGPGYFGDPYGFAPGYGHGYPPRGLPYGHSPWPRRQYDPAYPPVNRFYRRFQPPADRAAGLAVPDYGTGIHVLPPDPWRLPPWYWGVAPAACADLTVAGVAGAVWLQVGLPVLGATTPAELELAIDARLSQGQPVLLEGLDGRRLRIAAGTELERVTVERCGDRR